MKKFKTYEECEIAVGLTPGTLPDVSMLPEEYKKSQIADFKIAIICKAHNDGWEPNFNDYDEYKYNMCPRIAATDECPSGVGFSVSACDYWRTRTGCGSRHLLKSSELAMYIQEQFPEICKDHFLLK